MQYLIHIGILIGIYTILAVSLNLVAGYTGLLSIAHAAFYGIGAYTLALMALNLNTPFWINCLSATALTGFIGIIVGIPALQTRGDYFTIATFGFQVIIFNIFNNWVDLTRGPMGLTGIPQPTLWDWQISTPLDFLLLTYAVCIPVLGIVYRIVHSPFGRVLKAIREDEIFAVSLGKNVFAYKITIFVVGAMIAAVAGCLYASYVTFIDPTSFTVTESIFIISIVIVGGAGNLWGSIVGATFLIALPELLRFLGLPTTLAANIRQIFYGSLLIAFMLWRPQGLLGEFFLQTRERYDKIKIKFFSIRKSIKEL
ncbi:branched-chain amino acid ABC transporter permease [Scytonema hofmannii]|uniref:branched-chain amino acid ABC transporter permease n=1 Tax=Scytonema hofmannii TaxID=34078 RepID=UPI00034A5939|nr:branched-chain amino acid ABC transporter permease [Scytonema hofmannii]